MPKIFAVLGQVPRFFLRSFFISMAVVWSALPLRAEPSPEPLWITLPGTATINGVGTGESGVQANGSATDAAGNTYVVGVFHGRATFGTNVLVSLGTYPNRDIFLAKYDSTGAVLWVRRAGGVDADEARGVSLDASGNVFITGTVTSSSAAFGTNSITGLGNTMYVAKYGASGECVWVRRAGPWIAQLGNSGITYAGQMAPAGLMADGSGNVVVAGSFAGAPQFGGAPTNAFLPYNLSGGVVLTNSNPNPNGGSYDIFLAKYDATGALLWATSHGSTNTETVNSMAVDGNGGIYTVGSFVTRTVIGANTYTNDPTSTGPFVAKFSSVGTPVWSSSLGDATNSRTASAYAITVSPQGLATVAFQTKSSPYSIGALSMKNFESDPAFRPVWYSALVRFDAVGNPTWLAKLPFNVGDSGTPTLKVTIAQDAAQNTYAAGYGNWNLTLNAKASRGLTVAKYDIAGTGQWTNLISPNVTFGPSGFGGRLLGLDAQTNLYFAGTLRGDQTTVIPFGWQSVGNGFTNGFGDNLFLAKIAPTYVPVAPMFVQQPTNMVFQPPSGLTNFALARAWPVADYRWYFITNDVAARVGTNQVLDLPLTKTPNIASYYAVASNFLGQSTSTVVFAQPKLAILPSAQSTNSILLGGSGTLSVMAIGTSDISYQWRFNGANIDGATGANLVLNNIATNAAGPYTVVACNDWGCVTSSMPIIVKVVLPGAIDATYSTQLTGDAGMVRLADGRLLAAGFDPGYGGATQLYRGLTNGAFDTNFYLIPPSLGGTYAWWRSGANDYQGPKAFVVEPDGKIVVGGNFNRFYLGASGWTNVQKLVRLTAGGHFDPSFSVGSGAVDSYDFGNNQSGIRALVRQPDGKLIAAGWFRTFNGVGRTNIVRLNTDGSIDPSFVGQTFAYGTDYNNVGLAQAVALQSDGKILLGGNWQNVSGQDRPVLIRLNPDGTIDDTFAVMRRKDGSSTWPANGFCSVVAISLLPSGKIVITGGALQFAQTGYDNFGIFQLNADGTVDTNFVAKATGPMTSPAALAVQPDGKILLGGYGNVNRFLPTGEVDPEWRWDSTLTAYNIGTSRILIEPGGATALMAGSYGIKRILLAVDSGAAVPPSIGSGSILHLPNGQFGFTTCGQPGQTLVVEASTNLVNWISISTNTVTEGCVDFIDTQAPMIPNRYYRVIIQP
jgi:uncharacterized delta-60 repeat protein